MTVHTIGVDLGGTNVRAAAVDQDGVVLGEVRRSRPTGSTEVADVIAHLVETLEDRHGASTGVGIGAAGMVGIDDGVVHFAPNIEGLAGTALRSLVSERVQRDVRVDNDANVAALAELTYGSARGRHHAIVITIGTGIGGGIITNGAVLRGAHGFAAEVGHWQTVSDGPRCACGEPGHWEAIASGSALARMGRERAAWDAAPGLVDRAGGAIDAITGEMVGDAARAGDPDALAILHEFADNVALGVAGLVNIFDPELIAVSGGLADLGDVFLDPVRAAFEHRIEGAPYRPSVPVVAAELGSSAGVVGAAILARPKAESGRW